MLPNYLTAGEEVPRADKLKTFLKVNADDNDNPYFSVISFKGTEHLLYYYTKRHESQDNHFNKEEMLNDIKTRVQKLKNENVLILYHTGNSEPNFSKQELSDLIGNNISCKDFSGNRGAFYSELISDGGMVFPGLDTDEIDQVTIETTLKKLWTDYYEKDTQSFQTAFARMLKEGK